MDWSFVTGYIRQHEELELDDMAFENLQDEEELDGDHWSRYEFQIDGTPYKLTVVEDESPRYSKKNYEIGLSRRRWLDIDEEWGNWRRVEKEELEGYRKSSFREYLPDFIDEHAIQ